MKGRAAGRRGTPEAAVQRQVVAALRAVLPAGAVVHHSGHEQRGGDRRARLAQAVGVGMGVHPGFPDLIVISEGRVLFLEVKAPGGALSGAQRAFRDAMAAQSLSWSLVRSVDDALVALREHGFRTRIAGVP